MTVIQPESDHPAHVLSMLTCGGEPVAPTERWTEDWSVETGALTTNACVYGIYAREVPLIKWLNRGVRDLLDHYSGDVGAGTHPGGIAPFCVPDTSVQGLGRWVCIYVGQSEATSSPRITHYFGKTRSFTRGPGGQSFHLMLALFFGVPVDPRTTLTPRARTLIDVVRGSLSLSLEARMREMRFSYVQVETEACACSDRPCLDTCRCRGCSEAALLRRPGGGSAPDAGWPTGARPLMNSAW